MTYLGALPRDGRMTTYVRSGAESEWACERAIPHVCSREAGQGYVGACAGVRGRARGREGMYRSTVRRSGGRVIGRARRRARE